MSNTVLGVDADSATAGDAEHLIRHLAERLGGDPEAVLCTHPVRDGRPHYAGTLDWTPDPLEPALPDRIAAELPAGAGFALVPTSGATTGRARHGNDRLASTALTAAHHHASGRGGRAVRFPGIGLLTGLVSLEDALALTGIDAIQMLAGGALPADAVLNTRGFVRPEWRESLLVLLVLPDGLGRVAPFELPNPTACCATHG